MPPITRRTFLKTSAVATTMSTLGAAGMPGNGARKNVLFIGVDDQNTSLGCYGASYVHSPNLDALAKRGTRFAKNYCQYPWCGPSRASLMTGMAPDTTKIYDLNTRVRDTMPNAVTLGQLFRKDGYTSMRVGKIYHQNVPEGIGQDGLDDGPTWDYTFDPDGEDHLKDEPLVQFPTPGNGANNGGAKNGKKPHLGSTLAFYESPSGDEVMTDSKGADEVIRLLRTNTGKQKPFFLAYGLYRPHVPWIVPKTYFEMYPLDKVRYREFDPAELTQAPPPAYTSHHANYGMDEAHCREAIAAYSASTTFMDAQVGRVLAELKTLGLEDKTIVVFWADHGWCLGEHGQWQKEVLFEAATHVPLIFAGPGVAPGAVCERTVEHLDIYPTLVELCGLGGAPQGLHGASLVPLMGGDDAKWDRASITQVFRPAREEGRETGYTIRTERYRYTSWQGGVVGDELYDYQTDPREVKNMAAAAEMQPVKAELRAKLESVTLARGRTIALGTMAPGIAAVSTGV
jgi:iduronate 2-sulfatase